MARPVVFAALSLDAALARSREGAVLIVDAFAAWCGPCRAMDQTTWVDPAVVARLTGSTQAVAIQIDVDQEPAIAARLSVHAMPTMIAFVAGVEHDRIVGARRPAELLAWLDLVERGERFEDAERAARIELMERRARAPRLLADGQHADALVEYRWLWSRTHETLVDEIRQLARDYEPARVAFAELRGPEPTSLDGAPSWLQLNHIIGDDDATLRWYDAAELPPTRAVAALVEANVLPILLARGRWRAAGAALADPVATFHRLAKARPREVREIACNLVRALFAARRDERASDVEFEATSLDPSPELAIALAEAKSLGRES